MKNSLVLMFALFLIPCSVKAQNLSEDETARKHVPLSIEQLLSQQAVNATSEPDSESLNKRLALLSRHSQDYLLGPGDVVEVSVFGIPELNQKSLSLDSKGRISLPFIDEVQLLGLAARDAEVKIATLLEASILNDPQVTVKVTEYKSQFFNVLGSVQRPGTYQLTRQMSLVDAISLAGGLEKDADYSRVYIHRVPSGEDEPDDGKAAGIPVSSEPNGYSETIEVDLEDLLVVGNHRLNIPIYSRDVITVPSVRDITTTSWEMCRSRERFKSGGTNESRFPRLWPQLVECSTLPPPTKPPSCVANRTDHPPLRLPST